jgi:hypothetical protein
LERRRGTRDAWGARIDASGARRDPGGWPDEVAATYGDSFTFGSEVDDHETWQVKLGAALGARVSNYGVPAWSAHQAVLRFRRHAEEARVAPVTILGFQETNLLRSANLFRPFLAPKQKGWGTRPALRARDGNVRHLANPAPRGDSSRADVRDRVIAVAADDVFAERWARLRFPFSAQVLRFALRDESAIEAGLWETAEGAAILDELLGDFLATARGVGSSPMLVLFPGPPRRIEPDPPPYAGWRDAVRRRHPDLPVIDLAEIERDPARFQSARGHPSRYGTSLIARALLPSMERALAEGISTSRRSPSLEAK